METLITTIAEQVGIDRVLAEKAVGIILNLVKSDGDQSLVPDLMAAIPGASELADANAGGGGGLMGALGGALGSGGAMAAFGKLTQAGLDTSQIKSIGEILFAHAKEQAGEPLVKQVVSAIPGLRPYI